MVLRGAFYRRLRNFSPDDSPACTPSGTGQPLARRWSHCAFLPQLSSAQATTVATLIFFKCCSDFVTVLFRNLQIDSKFLSQPFRFPSYLSPTPFPIPDSFNSMPSASLSCPQLGMPVPSSPNPGVSIGNPCLTAPAHQPVFGVYITVPIMLPQVYKITLSFLCNL